MKAMAGPKISFTYRDYLLLPEEKRVELIGGEFYVAPAPDVDHQRISRNLEIALWSFVREKQLGEVLYAPCDVILSDSDVVQPDLLFVSRKRRGIIRREGIRGAPDLVVEILSPATEERDRETKLKLYGKHGVREYWLVDPRKRVIELFILGEEGLGHHRSFPEGTELLSPLLPGFRLPVEEVFQELGEEEARA